MDIYIIKKRKDIKKMKKQKITKFISLPLAILFLIMVVSPTTSKAAQPTVNLGTTAEYAVLAGSTITNTGTTIINGSVGGNIGLYPGTEFTGRESVTSDGSIHIADDAAIVAKDDLVIAYNDADSRQPVTRIPSELGETTLTPGTYDSADGTFQITGTLTLDAQGDPNGVFVFKTASTLITAAGSNVILINDARFCRTFWSVGSSATLGTNSFFTGHILAMTSITANTGAVVQGQLLARNGAVTLDNNTITNGICETIVPATPETPAEIITPPVTPEETTPPVTPEEITPPVTPEETTPPVISEETISPVTLEETITLEIPEETISTATPILATTDIIPQTGQSTDYTWAITFGSIALLLAGVGTVLLIKRSKVSGV